MAGQFRQDLNNQAAQTKKFVALVEETSANNKKLLGVTDEIMGSAKGRMANAFFNHAQEIH
ncbi:hypothetical protein NJB14197_49580 [Mycobacterium montefiorense]|uniref:Uncharacterized protein n=2 Tax=Mycobacterium montefiorense TaxID=154654 RepID=A0AA37PPA4_9MYCO|nr:hypothetical protein MmonteBS_49660 [Mycobacterium montefiorense]GKU33425.1 hypothetical protein NJB14191_07720 [Mycobacterium montefiorense]GKU39236.1 hypothetical protein NJB14192_12310 [Mycobacterium montefiorense]GKU44775.1 hypothetical protein NJB14194_14010 [Mycobacterium montefiorense]GKU52071.1 hypothetical protein NJB14195_33150 [Mycobacterium montefiorense]